jgi:hypothetical protein
MSSSDSAATRAPEARRSRRTALALLAVALAPVVAAVLAYFFWHPAGVNYGELLPPQSVAGVKGIRLDGAEAQAPFELASLRGRWVLVHVAGGRCGEPCVERHFLLRQVRLMQNRNFERIERLWIVSDDAPVDPKLIDGYPGMSVVRVRPDDLRRFEPSGDAAGRVFLVDPLGNLMMRFPADVDPKGVHRDLGRLLRASRVG